MRPGAVLGEELVGEPEVDPFDDEYEYLDERDRTKVVTVLAGADAAIERANRVCDKVASLLEIREKPGSA